MRKMLLAAVAVLALQATSAIPAAQAATSVSLALDSNPDRETSGTYRWADTFLNTLKAEGWDTERFARDTIGGEAERMDQIQSGILDMSLSNLNLAAQLVPEIRVVQLPYTFKDVANERDFFMKSDFLSTVNKKLAKRDVHIIAIVPNGGFLGIFNTQHAVHSVADMKGLRMRALDQSQLTMFGMMGASGVVIPWAEVPNSIQTGVADGYVNSAGVPITYGQTELFKYFTDAKVIISARMAVASTAWWDGLSDEEKAKVEKAANTASQDVFDWVEKTDSAQRKALAQAGLTVYEPTDAELATFADATKDMHSKVENVPQERVDEIVTNVKKFAK